ncbi:hypothetical protein E3U43_000727 [Larimichthys crocea]|nr:hypothetical protein E3U43_000727 [Larimichthys crocea]
MLLLAEGTCEALYWQKLTCPFELAHERLLRVWCRQDSTDCCTGLTFNQTSLEEDMDGGKLKVTQGPDFFTLAVLEPSLGNGIYWCGVLSQNNTIIKLAERYFHGSPGVYIWSFTRWILLSLLPLTTIFTNIYTRVMRKCMFEDEEIYDDIETSRPLAVPVNAASVCGLE